MAISRNAARIRASMKAAYMRASKPLRGAFRVAGIGVEIRSVAVVIVVAPHLQGTQEGPLLISVLCS
ncbi:MAG TPA: hypothetical protein VJT13_27515, partial [Xanthobacteraceae bacterium]|nr:hypothetical protein [Xanthobacteraceae bacterium]